MPTTVRSGVDTKTRIMNAAERMIARHGINGVSNRAILSEAGVNSAALHYHFNSREELIKAMITRHARFPVKKRFEMIEAFEASDRVATMSDVMDILVDPMSALLSEHGESGRRYIRFIARIQYDRGNQTRKVSSDQMPETKGRIGAILRELSPDDEKSQSDMHRTIMWLAGKLREICPDLSAEELDQRMTITIDVLLQAFSNADFMEREWDSESSNGQLLHFSTWLKTFLAAGLGAPPSDLLRAKS